MVEVNTKELLLIVVGAHLRAEKADRPVAYGLKEVLEQWLQGHAPEHSPLVVPVVCSDVWYLNNSELHGRPVISIGGPGVNALSAYYYQRLHTALAIEEKLVIQMDVELTDLRVAIWGADSDHTMAAVELFEKKYLDDFMQGAMIYVEPEREYDVDDDDNYIDDE